MKKLLLTGITATTLLFLTSCGGDGDDPAPAHEVGTWELDSYALQGFPTGFESNEYPPFNGCRPKKKRRLLVFRVLSHSEEWPSGLRYQS